jgi:hypothetical protein
VVLDDETAPEPLRAESEDVVALGAQFNAKGNGVNGARLTDDFRYIRDLRCGFERE